MRRPQVFHEKRQIKILFLSNLRIGDNSLMQNEIYNKLRYQLVNGFLGEKLDYIVLTGDLTTGNSSKSYDNLSVIVNQLCGALLRKDNGEVRIENRLIVVPGRTDYSMKSGEIDPSRFANFCKRIGKLPIYHSFEISKCKGSLSIENFSDISFVGVPHWASTSASFLLNENSGLNLTFNTGSAQNNKIDYCNSTPTILISNSSVLKDGELEPIKRYVESTFNFSLSTFSEPDDDELNVYYHSDKKYFQLNTERPLPNTCLEAKLMFYRPYGKNMTTLRIDSWQYLTGLDIWRREGMINGNVDSMVRMEVPKPDILPFRFSQINEVLFYSKSGESIGVSGFPGSGKSEFYKCLKEDEKFFPLEIEDPKLLIDDQEILKIQKINKLSSDSVLLVIDNAYYKVRPEEKEEYLNNLQKVLVYLSRYSKALVYFYSSMGSTRLGPIKKFTDKNETVKSLNRQDFKVLINQYSSHSPLDDGQISDITGKFPGYSRILLDDLHSLFQDQSFFHRKINSDSCWELLNYTFKSQQKLEVECYIFEREFKKLAAGRFLFNMITANLRKMISKKAISEIDLSNVSFEIEDNHEFFDEMNATVEILAEGGIFSKVKKNTYSVNLILPFLMSHIKFN